MMGSSMAWLGNLNSIISNVCTGALANHIVDVYEIRMTTIIINPCIYGSTWECVTHGPWEGFTWTLHFVMGLSLNLVV